MKLENYQIKWIKKTIDKNVSGSKTFKIEQDGRMLKALIHIKNEPLVSSELVLALAGKGMLMVWAGLSMDDKNMFEIAVSTFDEWVDYE